MMRRPTKLPQTLQEWFNIAWRAAVIEKKPKCFVIDFHSGFTTSCKYSDNGNHCLIGWGIPAKMYKPEFEGSPVTYLPIVSNFDTTFKKALDELQTCHDYGNRNSVLYSEEIEYDLRCFSEKYSLTIPDEVR